MCFLTVKCPLVRERLQYICMKALHCKKIMDESLSLQEALVVVSVPLLLYCFKTNLLKVFVWFAAC